jgi:hypothetical protein
METKTDKIKLFNSILESFLAQTSNLVGTTYHYYFTKLIKYNASMPIKYGSENLIVFKDQILNKDESYFTNESNLETINNHTDSKNEITLSEIMRLKDVYYKLDQESRENVWAILQALLQLSIEYNDLVK